MGAYYISCFSSSLSCCCGDDHKDSELEAQLNFFLFAGNMEMDGQNNVSFIHWSFWFFNKKLSFGDCLLSSLHLYDPRKIKIFNIVKVKLYRKSWFNVENLKMNKPGL